MGIAFLGDGRWWSVMAAFLKGRARIGLDGRKEFVALGSSERIA